MHHALYRASDNVLIKQWCDPDPDGSRDLSGKTLTWAVDDPTILKLGVEYYAKISVSADKGTNTDLFGTRCATGWSAEVKGPNIAAQGPPHWLSASETYGCLCTDTTGRTPAQGYLGDPVNTATRALNETAVDGSVHAPGVALALRRTYASDSYSTGMLGQGWTSAYDTRLQVTDAKVVYVADNGSRVAFTKDSATGNYTAASAGVTATLTGTAAIGFTVTTGKQGKLKFDGGGKLTSWKDQAGIGLSFAYTDGNLSSITDGAGNTIVVTVDPTSHLLTNVDLPGGRSVTYGYTSGRLTTVKGFDGGTTTYGYEDGLLASITDPAGHVVMKTSYDGSGRVTQQTDAEGKVTKYTAGTLETGYEDGNGGIWTDLYQGSLLRNRIDPLGNVTSFSYDANLRLTDALDARGNHTKMTYDSRGNLLTRTEGALTQTWTYNTNNKIESYTDGRGKKATYVYDTNLRLKEANGPAGKESYTYDALGNIKTTTPPGGKATSFDYDSKGNVTSETSPTGAKTTYTYDDAGRVLTTIDPRGNVEGADPAKYTTVNRYNGDGLLESTTDPLGNVTSYEYDANGNLKKSTDAAQHVTSYIYDKFNRVTDVTAPGGATTHTDYDAVGNVIAVTDPAGAKTAYGFDKANRLTSLTSPRGNAAGVDPAKYTTTYGYDNNGNVTKTVDPTGALTTTKYDTLNRPVLVTDALSHATATAYDGNGNVTTVTDARGKVTTFTYTDADLVETVKDPLGKITTFGYDPDGNQTSRTTPLGRKRTWTYDVGGRLKSETDPRGYLTGVDPAKYTTSYGYDADGNQTSVTDPLGNTQSTQYDALGRPTVREDAGHHKALLDYDNVGRIKTVTAADGGVTNYTYDEAGDLHTRVDDNKHTTTYTYDPAHRLTSVTDPLDGTVQYRYDQDGNRREATNARGVTATTAFDARGLPTGTTYGDSTPATSSTYDAVGNRKTVTDAAGTRTFNYDENNRVIGITLPNKTTGFSYGYDDAGHITSRTYPDGRSTSFTYTSDGNRDSSTTGGVKTTYDYTAAAQLSRTTLPGANGYVQTRVYDPAGRLTDINSAKSDVTLTSTHAEYDAAGQPKRVDAIRGTAATSHYYTYDEAGRLLRDCEAPTRADTCPSGATETAFTYDKVGNRLTQAKAGKSTTYSYDAADQLTQTTVGATTTSYGYDADGNQTVAGANKFTYDAANRLTSATVGSSTYGYTYDADGNRAAASKNGAALRTMTWDLNYRLPLLATENGSSGSLIADYQYNPVNQVQGETTGAGTFYYHHDLLGSVTDITDANGALQTSYSYTAFGEVTQTDSATSPPTNRFTYTGEYKEPTTSAAGYYLRSRNYAPDTGRFTSRDSYTPAQDTPAESSYAYVGNGPTHRYDPAGTCWWIPGSGDESCWTAEIPGTQFIPLEPAMNWIGDGIADSCSSGYDYAKANGRWGWTGCVDEFTGVGSMRRGADSFQQGDVANGTAQCLGGIGQFGLFFLPGPKAPIENPWGTPGLRPGTGAAEQGVGHATGTVWDRIAATQPVYSGTHIPKSFNLTTQSGRQVWVAPNSTKHIVEEIMHNGFSRDLKTEDLLGSLVRSVDAATAHGIQYGRRTLEKGWELIIVPPRGGVGNPVLKHARRLG